MLNREPMNPQDFVTNPHILSRFSVYISNIFFSHRDFFSSLTLIRHSVNVGIGYENLKFMRKLPMIRMIFSDLRNLIFYLSEHECFDEDLFREISVLSKLSATSCGQQTGGQSIEKV
jgi:hypothetical protein